MGVLIVDKFALVRYSTTMAVAVSYTSPPRCITDAA